MISFLGQKKTKKTYLLTQKIGQPILGQDINFENNYHHT
jgi:hypothetical protein